MTRAVAPSVPREDPELALPEAPGRVPVLDRHPAGLAVAQVAGPGALLVEGERCRVVGSQRGPLEVSAGSHAVARLLASGAGTAANLVCTPGLAVREWVGPDGVAYETVLALPTLPVAAVQWDRLPPEVVVEIPWGLEPGRYRVGPTTAVLVDGSGAAVVVGCDAEGASLEAASVGPEALRLRVRGGGGPGTLLVALTTEAAARTALLPARHLEAHARAARAARPEDGLTVDCGVAEVDEAFQWARRRLATTLALAAPPSDALWAGLAACAVGDRDAAQRAVRLGDAGGTAAAGLVAAALATTFGDAGPASRVASHLLDPAQAPSAERAHEGLRTAALATLADALHNAVAAERIEALRAAAEGARGAASGGGGVRLPMASGPAGAAGGWGRAVRALLRGDPQGPPPDGGTPAERALLELAARFAVDPDAAWLAWRTELARGLSGGPAGPGTWDAVPEEAGSLAVRTASLLLSAAHGLLGLSPDAPSGRLRWAPRLPRHLTRFGAHGARVGDAALTLRFERDGACARYRLEPTRGGVPPTVVFEPRVPGEVREVRIDGAPAGLELRREGDRTVVPAQIPVDGVRTVEIVTDAGG